MTENATENTSGNAGDSAAPDLETLKENFALFDDWEDRYRYLIDLGRGLAPLSEAQRSEENLVRGCTSKVWLICEQRDGRFYFKADSDAHIVRGLIALLMAAYQGQAASAVASVDIEGFFRDIGLEQHLSPSRRNGFFSMVEKIKAFCR
ncbi:MAG: SufE family protein [Alphaproteobacteria bacterium]